MRTTITIMNQSELENHREARKAALENYRKGQEDVDEFGNCVGGMYKYMEQWMYLWVPALNDFATQTFLDNH